MKTLLLLVQSWPILNPFNTKEERVHERILQRQWFTHFNCIMKNPWNQIKDKEDMLIKVVILTSILLDKNKNGKEICEFGNMENIVCSFIYGKTARVSVIWHEGEEKPTWQRCLSLFTRQNPSYICHYVILTHTHTYQCTKNIHLLILCK